MKKMLIEGYPDYFILETGVVWSIKTNKEVKHQNHPKGYIQVGLSKDNKQKTFKLHRLLGIHFIANPENKPTIDHINRDPSDNRLENLRWATQSEQNDNQNEHCIRSDNSTGHKNIYYRKDTKKWRYIKTGKYMVRKCFKSKTDALCFKFYWELKINLSQKTLRNFQLQ